MFCEKVKEFLYSKNIAFQEKNIVADPKALQKLQDLGYFTTPVTIIENEVVVGFDKNKLEELLS